MKIKWLKTRVIMTAYRDGMQKDIESFIEIHQDYEILRTDFSWTWENHNRYYMLIIYYKKIED